MLPRRFRWPLLVLTRVILPTIILAAIAFGILYVRLLNGEIMLKAIATPVARAIAAELPGVDVAIDDAAISLSETRGLEVRLKNVRLTDARGAPIAHAPQAAVTLSSSALLTARIAPARIVLIEPSLVLQHSRERGFALLLEDGPESAGKSQAAGRGDLGAAIAALLSSGDTGAGSASFVRGIGLRNATLAIDSAGQRTIMRIREADFGVERRRNESQLGANIIAESTRGPWQVTLVATREQSSGSVAIDARISDLVPSTLVASGPGLGPLSVLDMPVKGSATFKVSSAGALTEVLADIELGRGSIAPGWRGKGRMPVEGGRVSLKYEGAARRIAIATTRMASGASWASFAGTIALPEDGSPWNIDIASTEGHLAADEFAVPARPLDAFRVRGRFDPGSGAFEIGDAVLRAGGGEIQLSGLVPPQGIPARLQIQGRLSPMSVETLKLLWPSVIAPNARAWSGRQILQGRMTSGTFSVEDVGTGADRGRAGPDGLRVALAIEGANVRIQPKPGFSPVEAPRVLVRLEGNSLEVAAPEAVVITSPQRRLPIRGVRMSAVDVTSPTAFGDLTFRAQGSLPAALDLAEQQAARNGRNFALPGEGLDGRIDAQVRILVPLGEDVTGDDTKLDIKGRVIEGRARNVIGSWDVNGASLAVEITDQQLDTRGDVLIAGVPAKVAVKRIFSAPDSEQPPIHLAANLDTADRVQLGLDVNDFVIGEMPIEVLVSPRAQAEPQIQVRANLTSAELVIDALAWRKASGRPATLQFEIVRPNRQRTELQGFRIVGEDISMSGVIGLDARNRVRDFNFHELALHVVSRLQLSGAQKPDNSWDVTVRGQTLDGRDFFQSLFSVGNVRAKAPPPRKDQSALDLKVEIDNVLGHHDLSLKQLRMQVSNRGGRTVALQARGLVDNAGRGAPNPLTVTISQSGRDARMLNARTDDAGQVFRLIGFFPNMQGGTMNLDVNLDGSGAIEKTGRLHVERFAILGDQVSGDMASLEAGSGQRGPRRAAVRSRLEFDSMRAPFELGNGQVVIREADLRGQVLGVVVTGKADFTRQFVDVGGTYVPLQGLNSAIGFFPILGQILAGPRGEGVIGMTFLVRGPMSKPEITVNPVSIVPGILREMMKMNNPDPRITPRAEQPQPAPQAEQPGKVVPKKGQPVRASSTQVDSKTGTTTAAPPQVGAEGGWNSGTVKAPPPRPAARPE